jgi:protein required for attachment to host cells
MEGFAMTNLQANWVVVADGAHARFLAVEPRADAPQGDAVRLVEHAQLDNPEHTAKGRRDARKIKSGRDNARGGVDSHGYTDHREPHEAELLRRFAVKIAQQMWDLHSLQGAKSVVLVAEPRMLGLLRTAVAPVVKSGVNIRELARDYTWCAPLELEQHLDANKLL